MASTSDAKKALETTSAPGKAVQPGDTLAAMIRSMKPEIAMALPKHMDPDRMARIATTLMRTVKGLADCTPASFLGALMTCAQLGLEPGPLGLAWILPYKNNDRNSPAFGRLEANFQLGYKGAIELARRSGQLAKITARTVYESEVANGDFTVLYEGATETVVHRPDLFGERGDPVLYYCAAKLTNGEEIFTPLRPIDVEERHRKRSKAPNGPGWTGNYESMAWKSTVVEARRWLPQSPELEQAVAQDGRTRTNISPDVLDTPIPEFVDSTAEDVTEPDGASIVDGGGAVEPDGAAPESRTGWPATKRPPDTAPDGTVKP